MLILLFLTIVMIPTLSGWGNFFESVFKTQLFDGISGKSLTGIFGITVIWAILAFFIPLNLYVEVPTILIGLFYFFKEKLFKEFYTFTQKETVLLVTISCVILFCGSYYPFILDHYGYYVPTINWLKEYGLVKGISNLDLTLGQMSFWHIFQAGFSNFSDPFLRINAILLVIYTFYIIEKRSWIQLCFIPFFLFFCQSPSPDLSVLIFSLIILREILSGNTNATFIFAFSVFVFAIKPTMIWLPFLGFFYNAFITKAHFKVFFFGILIALLFFIKNIWTFGYPVFPVTLFDLGISWKPNPALLQSSSQYAVLKTYDAQYSYKQIQHFSASDSIKNWLFLTGIKSYIHIFFIISLIIFTLYAAIKKNKIITFIWVSLIIKSIMVLAFSAQYRFFMDVFFVIFFVMLFDFFTPKKSLVVFSVLCLISVVFLSFPRLFQTYIPSFKVGGFMGKFDAKQLYKPSIYHYKKYNSFKVGNLKYHVSEQYPFNFDTPLPSISESFIFDDYNAGIFPQCIDPQNIRKGFIWKKMTPEEKKESQTAIDKIKNTYSH